MDDGEDITRFGFIWGPAHVERIMVVPGRGRTIYIGTPGGPGIEVYVSEKGRRIRVFDSKTRRELTT